MSPNMKRVSTMMQLLKTRTILDPTAILILLATIGLTACGRSEEPPAPDVVRPVRTTIVGGLADGRLVYPGIVQGEDRAELAFRVDGPLIQFPVDEGDYVAQGDLLAALDPTDYDIAVAEAVAAFNQAQADWKRFQRLYERNAVPLADLELKRAMRDVSDARLSQARKNRSYTVIYAPFDGVVGEKYVQNFESVRAKELILSLASVDIVEIVVDVPEAVIATIPREAKAVATARFATAPDQQFPLAFSEIAARASAATQTFRVTMAMEQPEDLRVLPGMSAEVSFEIEADFNEGSLSATTVPATAVGTDAGGQTFVWTVGPDRTVERRDVELGRVTGLASIQVLAGLSPGDRIVTAGVSQLSEGTEVRPMDN